MFKRLSLCALLCLPAGISHAEGVLKRFYCVVRSVDSASGFTCERYRQPPGSYRIERSAVRVTLLAYQPPAAAHPLAAQAASTLASPRVDPRSPRSRTGSPGKCGSTADGPAARKKSK